MLVKSMMSRARKVASALLCVIITTRYFNLLCAGAGCCWKIQAGGYL